MRHLRGRSSLFRLLPYPAPRPAAPSFGWERLMSAPPDLRLLVTVSRVLSPDTPAPARPAVPVGDGRAGAGMGRRDAFFEGGSVRVATLVCCP